MIRLDPTQATTQQIPIRAGPRDVVGGGGGGGGALKAAVHFGIK